MITVNWFQLTAKVPCAGALLGLKKTHQIVGMTLVSVTYLDEKWDMSFRVKIESQMSLCHSGASKNGVRAEREGERQRERRGVRTFTVCHLRQ